MPTAVRVSERPRVVSDSTFESADDVAGYVVQHCVAYRIYLLTEVIVAEIKVFQPLSVLFPVTLTLEFGRFCCYKYSYICM